MIRGNEDMDDSEPLLEPANEGADVNKETGQIEEGTISKAPQNDVVLSTCTISSLVSTCLLF